MDPRAILRQIASLSENRHIHILLLIASCGPVAAPRLSDAFEPLIANTGEVLEVSEYQTAIDDLRVRRIMADYSCEGGICGECRQELVTEDVDHHDTCLKPEEHGYVVHGTGRRTVRLPENSPNIDYFS